MAGPIQQKRVLITVRTYPTPAKKGVEVSCTAGVTEEGKWIRLFPIPYRFMDPDKRFKRYQWIELNVTKASDPRPESYTPDLDSIRIVGQVKGGSAGWHERRRLLTHLVSHCLCCLKAERDAKKYPTLGLFQPHLIKRLVLDPVSPDWSEQELARLRQYSLFHSAPRKQLEKLPFKFKYAFTCDHGHCPGHLLSCTDWEMGQAYRSWRAKYGEGAWEAKFRQRFEQEVIHKYDTHFYVGTLSDHPAEWLVAGLLLPPVRADKSAKSEQPMLPWFENPSGDVVRQIG